MRPTVEASVNGQPIKCIVLKPGTRSERARNADKIHTGQSTAVSWEQKRQELLHAEALDKAAALGIRVLRSSS